MSQSFEPYFSAISREISIIFKLLLPTHNVRQLTAQVVLLVTVILSA